MSPKSQQLRFEDRRGSVQGILNQNHSSVLNINFPWSPGRSLKTTDLILFSGCPRVKARAWGQRIPVNLSQVRAWIVSHSQLRLSVLCSPELMRPLEYLLGQDLGDLRQCQVGDTRKLLKALGLQICGTSGDGSACTRRMH